MDRPRRSALYLPGSNQRAIEKSRTLDCDVIIFDLEDSVAPEAKSLAREQVHRALAEDPSRKAFGNKELVVRVNGSSTPWYAEDVRAISAACPHAILLPKVESADQVDNLANDLAKCEEQGQASSASIWCMIETPKGVLRCESIAGAHPRLDCLVMGTSDLTQDMRALHTSLRLPMLTSLGLCLLAARAYGLTALDGVALDLNDEPGFIQSCAQGREFGFDGKTLIHPKQIGPCNAVFSPSAEAVSKARAVVEAFRQARANGRGVVVLDGRLVEELHVREAQRVLALHESLEERVGSR
ncbi:MAG: CoA ester lyase [Polyangiaceae bacterium]